MARFSKSNVLAHIQNRMDMLVERHGERIQEGYYGIDIMKPSFRRDELIKAWGAWHELFHLRSIIRDGNLKEIKP